MHLKSSVTFFFSHLATKLQINSINRPTARRQTMQASVLSVYLPLACHLYHVHNVLNIVSTFSYLFKIFFIDCFHLKPTNPSWYTAAIKVRPCDKVNNITKEL